jgi:hypothetical protein
MNLFSIILQNWSFAPNCDAMAKLWGDIITQPKQGQEAVPMSSLSILLYL